MMQLRFRPVALADAEAVAEVRVRTWQAAYAGLLPAGFLDAMDVELNADRFRQRLASPATPTNDWLLEVDGHVAGWAHIQPASRDQDAIEGVAELCALYVLPRYWGMGLGHSMMERLSTVLRDQGAHEITLWVLADNVQARRFYARQGFRADGHTKEVSLVEGLSLMEVRYRRAI